MLLLLIIKYRSMIEWTHLPCVQHIHVLLYFSPAYCILYMTLVWLQNMLTFSKVFHNKNKLSFHLMKIIDLITFLVARFNNGKHTQQLIVYNNHDAFEMAGMTIWCQTLSQEEPLNDFCRNLPYENMASKLSIFYPKPDLTRFPD